MKGKLKVALILVTVLLLSGCMKYNINMSIDENKDVTISAIVAMDKSMTQGLESGESTDDEDVKALKEKGYTYEKYSTDEWDGAKLTKKVGNLDEISTTDPITVELDKLFDEKTKDFKYYFQKKESGSKTTYIGNFKIDASEGSDSTSSETDEMTKSLMSSMDLKYVVTLPVKSDSNNATKVSKDGKTLTWDLTYGKVSDIKYEFSLNESGNKKQTILIVAGAAVAVVAVAVTVVVINSKKKESN